MSVGPTHDEPLPPGALVGRHRIERLLRRRVAGTDYLATAPYPGAPAERVLLTVVDRAASITPAFGNWFRDAIEKASAMAHPGIARITGHGIVDGRAWVAVAPVPASDAALLMNKTRHDADLASFRRDDAGAVGADQTGFSAAQILTHSHHIGSGDPFGDADDEPEAGVGGLHDGVRREGGRHEDDGCVGARGGDGA